MPLHNTPGRAPGLAPVPGRYSWCGLAGRASVRHLLPGEKMVSAIHVLAAIAVVVNGNKYRIRYIRYHALFQVSLLATNPWMNAVT